MVTPEEARQNFFREVPNCYWNPKLAIKTHPNGDRTVVTNAPIGKDEPLVVLNPGSSLSADQCHQYSKEELRGLPEDIVLPAYLYQFFTGHTDLCPQGYIHYLHALPTYEWYAKNHEVIAVYKKLSKEKREEIRNHLYLIDGIERLIDWANTIPNHKPNIQEAIRSVAATTSRSWSQYGLVPWIDFFNHKSNGSVLGNAGTTIKASHEYNIGDEVNTSYGEKDSLQLLSIYGYLSDRVTVALPLVPISGFATAVDSSFEAYKELAKHCPLLLDETLSEFKSFMGHYRLVAMTANDALFTTNLSGTANT